MGGDELALGLVTGIATIATSLVALLTKVMGHKEPVSGSPAQKDATIAKLENDVEWLKRELDRRPR